MKKSSSSRWMTLSAGGSHCPLLGGRTGGPDRQATCWSKGEHSSEEENVTQRRHSAQMATTDVQDSVMKRDSRAEKREDVTEVQS